MKFRITIAFYKNMPYVVEAETQKEAEEKALEMSCKDISSDFEYRIEETELLSNFF